MCVWLLVCRCTVCMYDDRSQTKESDPLELELHVTVSCRMGLLAIELESSAKAAIFLVRVIHLYKTYLEVI